MVVGLLRVRLVAASSHTFAFEVVGCEGRVEVDVILVDLLAPGLLHEGDVVDDREEHVFDVVSAERRCFVVLHFVFFEQFR